MKGGVWCPSADFRETFIDSLVLGDLDRFAAHMCDSLGCGTEWYLIKEKTSKRHKQAEQLVVLLIDRRRVTVDLVRNALRDSHNETLLSKFDSENSTKAMEGFNYGNFKHELRGLLTAHVLEAFCDALPNMTGVLREKILDQRNANALLSFLENHGYMGETRGISKLAVFCSHVRGLATVAELCENFCPSIGKNSSQGDDMKSSSSSTPMLDLPPPFLNKVCVACTRTWEDIAWHMGYRNSDDRLVFGQSRVPMNSVLEDHWAQSGKKMTVAQFIEVLRRSERPRNDIIALLEGAPSSSQEQCPSATTLTPAAAQRQQAVSNPLAAAIASQQRQVVTTQSFLQDSSNALRNSLLLAMDESEAWFALLAAKNLLHGPEMEKWVASLRKEWTASRANEPSLHVVRNLCQHDAEFARGTLVDLANLLNALKIPAVTQAISKAVEFYEGKQAKTQEKSSTAFSAQGELRVWLVQNNICEEEEVDGLVLKLRGEGVRNVADLQGFDKDDLKELGFSTRQAIAVVKKISNAK
jgi:hypothetical protein